MEHQRLKANRLRTISWRNNKIIDWELAGKEYSLDGTITEQFKYTYFYKFDAAITSPDGQYGFIYEWLGTKGLLLKNGELLREINRPYYCAEVHEYPAVFIELKGKTYLIHCPLEYDRIDFEDADTGELITNVNGRTSPDIFHSRLELSPGNKFLMSKGWVWHPRELINVFKITDILSDPTLLNGMGLEPDVYGEISMASFINDDAILIGSSDEIMDDDERPAFPPKHIAIWDLNSNTLSKPVKVNGEFGNLFAIDENLAWDMFSFPKIINIKTGEIVAKDETIDSGKQASSIMHHVDGRPQIIFNRETKQIAISGKDSIDILTP